jgi:hypothetical protein
MPAGAVVICGLLLSQAAASTQATGRIAGRIVADGTNTPVAGARIVLLPSMPPRPTAAGRPIIPMWRPFQAQSDEDGRFVIEQVEPGTYRLEVQKTGFAPVGVEGRGATTEVASGKTTDVRLALHKGGVIAGKVLDAQGEPLADIRLMAMRRMERPAGMPAPAGSAFLLVPAPFSGQQQTNDLGEYRIAGLAPGEYYVAAMPNGAMSFGGPGSPASSTGKANTATYYPGTNDQAAATPIKVTAGETIYNIVFSMQSAPAFRISGLVVDENGAPVNGAMVMLMPARPMPLMGPPGHATSGEDGRFTFTDVPSAAYRVNASIPIQLGNGTVSAAGGAGGTVAISSPTVSSSGVTTGGGSFASWTSIASGRGGAGSTDQATEVTVNDADVSGVRVVVRRPKQP